MPSFSSGALGKEGSWYLQHPRKQVQGDKSLLGRRHCGDAVPREAAQSCGLAGRAGNYWLNESMGESPRQPRAFPKYWVTIGHHSPSCIWSCWALLTALCHGSTLQWLLWEFQRTQSSTGTEQRMDRTHFPLCLLPKLKGFGNSTSI